ncbi:hypothetical protein HY379_01900 [Candidatus Saccharibacteria bacterium]|nr:hypothetical protein [Candidatus Saccharibacteria bacterium]
MNEAVINDLKQFITVTVSQHIADVREDINKLDHKLSQEIKNLDNRLSRKIDDLSESVATAISTSNDEVDKQLQNHETRITSLETKTA